MKYTIDTTQDRDMDIEPQVAIALVQEISYVRIVARQGGKQKTICSLNGNGALELWRAEGLADFGFITKKSGHIKTIK